MSDYVVHFAKIYDGKKAYDNMLGILSNRVIRARNPFGIARSKAPDIATQYPEAHHERRQKCCEPSNIVQTPSRIGRVARHTPCQLIRILSQ